MTYDYLIVGSGLYGSTCARLLADAGRSVQVIERRVHLGGNCYDEMCGDIRWQLYGGHILHTNSRRVWDFLQRFDAWQPYEHRVKVNYMGIVYSFPPNKLTISQIKLATAGGGPEAIERMFLRGYSEKQWGRPFEDIPQSIIRRVPVRDDYDDRYFTDAYQGLPMHGYAHLVNNMLDGIPVEIDADYNLDREYWRKQARRVIYSGSLDDLYGADLGKLEYRSLRFATEIHKGVYQGCATMNYTWKQIPYTRIHEWKYFGYQKSSETVITKEYPEAYDGTNERYYPVPTPENESLHRRYAERAEQDGYVIGGRLGAYRYWNMDQAIANAMHTVEAL